MNNDSQDMLVENALGLFASGVKLGLTDIESALRQAFELGRSTEKCRAAEARVLELQAADGQAPSIPRESVAPRDDEPTLKVEADKTVRLQHMLEAL